MLVWDHKSDPPAASEDVLLWQGGVVSHNGESIPRYLETHATRLRGKYLEFIHDLGEHPINGKPVVEHLALRDGFSFWWMTQLAEKSPFKSPRLYACLRLLALEEMVLARSPAAVTLDSADRDLAQSMRRLCETRRILFTWRRRTPAGTDWSLRGLYRALPYALQGLLGLRHILIRWPLRSLTKPAWFSGDNTVFLCTYFFNLDPAHAAAGRFYPRQWEGLPAHFRDTGIRSNWIHHFLRGPGLPDIRTGLDWVQSFNRDSVGQGRHAFLESYLSFGVVFRVLRRWLWINQISWRLRHIREAFVPRGSAVWLWPLLRDDWGTSLRGPVAVANCLWLELFDAALKNMPRQMTGLYIWENQGWECALLRAWRRHGHGQLTGVPHATTVFWHLNNFDDPRSLDSGRKFAKPLPDKLAVNGPMAWNAFASTGYPPERLAAVEALRFQYLIGLGAARPDAPATAPAQGAGLTVNAENRVLILGDFTAGQTLKMLRCIETASHLTGKKYSFTLKPHPVCPIRQEDFPTLAFDLTDRHLAEILPDFATAFSSNNSSAGLDALLAGLHVIVFLDDEDFNHSPLRGVAGVWFANCAEELAGALETGRRNAPRPAASGFFWLDRQLPRWTQVLSGAARMARHQLPKQI